MTRDEIIAKLRATAPALRAEGVSKLAIFGSRARGDDAARQRSRHPRSRWSRIPDSRCSICRRRAHRSKTARGLHTQVSMRRSLEPRMAERIADDLDRGILSVPPDARRSGHSHSGRRSRIFGDCCGAAHARDFEADLMLRMAVERLFEIISEASRFIPEDMKAKEKDIAWQRMADLGNWLRHAYHRIDARDSVEHRPK